jgi:electron transfer flavoprotein alpha subunit
MPPRSIVVCTWGSPDGGIAGLGEEVLTIGRRLSSAAAGAELVWLALGDTGDGAVATAGRYGARRVDRVRDPKLQAFQPDVYVEALRQYCVEHPPEILLFPQTFDVRLVAPRLAGRLGATVVMNGTDLEIGGEGRVRVTASAYGGDTRVVYELAAAPPYVVAVGANAVQPEPAAGEPVAPAVRDVAVDLAGVEERIRVVARSRAEGPRLEHAQIIVAGGRGLGAAENFRLVEELAQAIGGMAAASRPIVDDGWVEPSRQIGLTGKITRPALYIGAGISGASQHMVGCAAAKTIVAINRDRDAAIFRHARYGLVGDCLEILPALTRAAKAR